MLTDLFCRYSCTYLMLELLCIWRLFPVLRLSIRTWGYLRPAYVRRHNVSVSLGAGRYRYRDIVSTNKTLSLVMVDIAQARARIFRILKNCGVFGYFKRVFSPRYWVSPCNAPIPRIRRRYGDVHTQGENTIVRTLSLSTRNSLYIHKSSSIK